MTVAAQPQVMARSPFDELRPDEIPDAIRETLPAESVAVVQGTIGSVYSCALSGDGKLAMGGNDGAMELWDLTGTAPRAFLLPQVI